MYIIFLPFILAFIFWYRSLSTKLAKFYQRKMVTIREISFSNDSTYRFHQFVCHNRCCLEQI